MTRLTKALALAAAVLITATAAQAQSPATPPPPQAVAPIIAHVDGGMIAGKSTGGVAAFLGVPYAAAPVGDLRWRAPRPVAPWTGIRPATTYAPVCRQTASWITEPQSEDCLYLNVWAPAAPGKARLPVMVWIHGGGFFGGSGSQPLYDGAQLVRRDVIVVTLNYRLGLFGFFSHPELGAESPDGASGDQGLLDQIAALEWVQRNIGGLGGDPKRVTIMGESAGAISVAALVVSPRAKGLFQRAISQSGNVGLPFDPTERAPFDRTAAEATGLAFARETGAASLADLRRLSADDLIKRPWTPRAVVDGVVLREDQTTAYQTGRRNRVPILVGWNADEGKDLAPEVLATSDFTAARHPALIAKLLGRPPSAALLQAYPAKDDAEAPAAMFHLVSDFWGWRIWRWARLHQAKTERPAYFYYFVHSPAAPSTPCGYGCNAGHGAEIRYMFDHLDQDDRAWNAEDRRLAARMVGYWTNFAKYGDPNGPDLPGWKPFDGSEGSVRRLGSDEEIAARGRLPDFSLFGP
ncbi:carboxylesterase/lipase family protein [Caulobacter sp. LARHSG274]